MFKKCMFRFLFIDDPITQYSLRFTVGFVMKFSSLKFDEDNSFGCGYIFLRA